jgi:nucleotide-binding universal stress UspA family protein
MKHKILVPVDFTDISAYGTKLAVQLSGYLNAAIHFIHVVHLPSHILLTNDGELFEDGDFNTDEVKKTKANAEIKIKQWANEYDHQATTCVCYGDINSTVLEYAQQHAINLIVMGTHAVSGMREFLTHTHGEYIAMHSHVPVLTIKSDRIGLDIKNIVLAGSYKKDDMPNCETAIAIQKAFNATLHLLRVNTPHDSLADELAIAHMKAFADHYQIKEVKFAIAQDNDVEDGIIKYVSENNIDVIAIGTKQRKGLNKIINGCVSADLVNHIQKPILTFKINK